MKLEDHYIEKDVLQIAEAPWQLSFFTELEGSENPIINKALEMFPEKAAFIYRGSKKVKIIFSYEDDNNTFSEFSLEPIFKKEFLINLDYNVLIFEIKIGRKLINFLKAIKEKKKTKISIEITREELQADYNIKIAPPYKVSGEFSDYRIKLYKDKLVLNLDARSFIQGT